MVSKCLPKSGIMIHLSKHGVVSYLLSNHVFIATRVVSRDRLHYSVTMQVHVR